LEGELAYQYTNLTSDLLKWIKTKLDFINRENNFETIEIKNDEFVKYNQLLHRIRSIYTEFEVKEY